MHGIRRRSEDVYLLCLAEKQRSEKLIISIQTAVADPEGGVRHE